MFDPYHKWLGIPPKDQPPNHYRLLGVDLFESDADVIDTAANKQMAYLQGCATGPHMAASQKLLNEIAAARLCLLSPKKKAAYDTQLKAKMGAKKEALTPVSDAFSFVGDGPADRAIVRRPSRARYSTLQKVVAIGGGMGLVALISVSILFFSGVFSGKGARQKEILRTHPAIEESTKPVYLSDLAEVDACGCWGGFGKNGKCTWIKEKIVVNGKPSPKGLAMHPLTSSYCQAAYQLTRPFQSFKGAVALNDSARLGHGPQSPATFTIRGDNQELWKSRPLRKPGESQAFDIPVGNVKRLELRVYCPGSNSMVHAVWVDPYLK